MTERSSPVVLCKETRQAGGGLMATVLYVKVKRVLLPTLGGATGPFELGGMVVGGKCRSDVKE